MGSAAELPWCMNLGDFLNSTWPLAGEAERYPRSPDEGPCSHPPCPNIMKAGRELRTHQKRIHLIASSQALPRAYLDRSQGPLSDTSDNPTSTIKAGQLTAHQYDEAERLSNTILPDC